MKIDINTNFAVFCTMTNAFFWVITQRVMVIPYRRFGTKRRPNLQKLIEDGNNRLSRNVGNFAAEAWNHAFGTKSVSLIVSSNISKKFDVHMSVHRKYISKVQPTRYTFSRSIYFYKLLYKFQTVPPPIIRSRKLYIQRQVLSNQYCCLLLSWMRWNRLKHVGQFIEITRSRKCCILLVVLQRFPRNILSLISRCKSERWRGRQ